MASINALVSEIAHSVGRPDNIPFKEQLKLFIIQTRNELIRRSYENHSYVDKHHVQRFKIKLIDVNDGEIVLPEGCSNDGIVKIKRSENIVPKSIRLTNNLPFDRVSTVGYKTNKEIPFIKETTARFVNSVPGLCGTWCYDYINGYIYIFPTNGESILINNIIIESAFENPTPIDIKNGVVDEFDALFDDNDFLLSEDMIGQIREIIYKRDLFLQFRETNEHSINTDVI